MTRIFRTSAPQIFICVKFYYVPNFYLCQILRSCKFRAAANFGSCQILGAASCMHFTKSFGGCIIRFYHAAAKFTELNEFESFYLTFLKFEKLPKLYYNKRGNKNKNNLYHKFLKISNFRPQTHKKKT